MKNQWSVKQFLLLLIAPIMLLSSSVFAGDVLTVRRDKRYHLSGCPKIEGKPTMVLDEDQAKIKALRPCPVCFKDKTKESPAP